MDASSKQRGESFVFYVGLDNEDTNRPPSPVSSSFSLLSDEREICDPCKRVIFYPPFCDNRQGILGTLHCTTFRLIFAPIGETDLHTTRFSTSKILCNLRYETPILNVHSIYYTSNADGKKMKPLNDYLAHSDQVALVKIYCKDFRIISLDFKMCNNGYRMLLNGLILRAFPKVLNTVISAALDILPPTPDGINDWRLLSFDKSMHWEMELKRLNVPKNLWKITSINERYQYIDSYPQYFVVPAFWSDNTIKNACGIWAERRIPAWCWSSQNSCALLRSAQLDAVGEIPEKHWLHFEHAVAESHYLKKRPVIVDINNVTVKEVAQSSELLRKLCSMDSASIFWDNDARWHTELDHTNWLSLIVKCLSHLDAVLTLILDEGKSVIIREFSNSDSACLISSLAQLCLDKYFRTVEGFHVLLQKEWCALSHPFSLRLHGLIKQGRIDEEMSPMFLLFLDCVHQLQEQYPTEFEFSQYYLIALWDLALSGVCKSFLFNSLKESHNFANARLRPMLSFNVFYKFEYTKLFKNPLYAFLHGLKTLDDEGHKSNKSPSGNIESSFDHERHHLRPRKSICHVTFWSECYLRWTAPCQILRGGGVQTFIELVNICSEITELLRENVLHDRRSSPNSLVRRSETLRRYGISRLNLDPDNPDHLENVTSGFPYSSDTLPVPELLYTLPVKTESQYPSMPNFPRSVLELAPVSEINTDIRRLSMARIFGDSSNPNSPNFSTKPTAADRTAPGGFAGRESSLDRRSIRNKSSPSLSLFRKRQQQGLSDNQDQAPTGHVTIPPADYPVYPNEITFKSSNTTGTAKMDHFYTPKPDYPVTVKSDNPVTAKPDYSDTVKPDYSGTTNQNPPVYRNVDVESMAELDHVTSGMNRVVNELQNSVKFRRQKVNLHRNNIGDVTSGNTHNFKDSTEISYKIDSDSNLKTTPKLLRKQVLEEDFDTLV